MTDKQIIIDGTKCKYAHFDGGNTQRLLCAIDDCFCDCYRENECYFKQLKRKEQEYEELKKIINEAKNSKLDLKSFLVGEAVQNEYEQQLDQLKAENERLKKEIRLYDCINKWGTEQCHCACRCLGNEFCDAAEEKMKNIKQTLANIKEIAEEAGNTQYLTFPDFNLKQNVKMLMGQFNGYLQQILQKISEVEK